uniref:Uncharacterized protein n=1 Tax=Oryza brachyantha TaxID=4533 RepID=J3M7R1_ORYBR
GNVASLYWPLLAAFPNAGGGLVPACLFILHSFPLTQPTHFLLCAGTSSIFDPVFLCRSLFFPVFHACNSSSLPYYKISIFIMNQ